MFVVLVVLFSAVAGDLHGLNAAILRLRPHDNILAHYTAATAPHRRTRQGVYEALYTHAGMSQRRVRDILDRSSVKYESLWIENALILESVPGHVLQMLEELDEVESVKAQQVVHLPPRRPSPAPFLAATSPEPQANIAKLNTAALWNAGVSGEGVVVATIDSGVRWTHEALRDNYRGFNKQQQRVQHDYSMWTPDSLPLTPDTVDIYGHGTHVTGTLAGAGPHNIGMAPNATWIHAKAFSWDGAASEANLIKAAQWVLCPTKYDVSHSDPDCSKVVTRMSTCR